MELVYLRAHVRPGREGVEHAGPSGGKVHPVLGALGRRCVPQPVRHRRLQPEIIRCRYDGSRIKN